MESEQRRGGQREKWCRGASEAGPRCKGSDTFIYTAHQQFEDGRKV